MSYKKGNPGAVATARGAKGNVATQQRTLTERPPAEQDRIRGMRRPYFILAAESDEQDCAPLAELMALLDAGKLPRFAERWGQRNGDCHEIASLLIQDLVDAGSRRLWAWWFGDTLSWGTHSWLESDGWALDAAHGKWRPVLVMRAAVYQKLNSTQNTILLLSNVSGASC